MAGSVHPGVMPIKHMLSMAGQTDVGMEKEELGLMTFTGFQVLKLFSHDVIDYAGGRKLRQLLITSSGSRGNRFTSHAVFLFTGRCKQRTVTGNCCVFPFRYGGRIYRSCTTRGSRLRRAWCPTLPGYRKGQPWGYCRGYRGKISSCEVRLIFCLFVESSNRSCLGDFRGHLSTHRTGQKSKRKKLGPQL